MLQRATNLIQFITGFKDEILFCRFSHKFGAFSIIMHTYRKKKNYLFVYTYNMTFYMKFVHLILKSIYFKMRLQKLLHFVITILSKNCTSKKRKFTIFVRTMSSWSRMKIRKFWICQIMPRRCTLWDTTLINIFFHYLNSQWV